MELINREITMTSLDITEVTGKRHDHVMRDIKNEIGQLGEKGLTIFGESEYYNLQNKKLPCFTFGRKGAMQIITRYSADIRYKVIERIEQLEKELMKPKSELELIIQSAQEIQRVEKKVEALENKFNSVVTLESGKQRIIQKAVAKRVYYRFEEKTDEWFKNSRYNYEGFKKTTRSKLFANLYRELKNKFGVASYKDIKVVQFDDAIKWIENWIEDADLI